ncbi:MAG: T9SS type A sorting domain-containing protein [Candidatus Azobacteroides sp.]|nr:T9SS type A sorting domain-containing protein [Candidatus Azobacteroides sp.]
MKTFHSFLFILCCILFHLQPGNAGNVEDTDYIQILFYEQSLGMGWEAPRVITTELVEGNYMLGDMPMIRSWFPGSTQLNPLVATLWESGGEQPVVSCTNVFSGLYRENVKAGQKFIGMFAGEGGQTIELFSKECTNNGFYEPTFIKLLDRTVSAMKDGETVSCPAIIYVQGEFNYNQPDWYEGKGLTPGTDGTTDKDEYKRLLLILKNNMQADIMEKYGQQNKPLFFLYQCSGAYLRDIDIPISMAQLEFARENDDVILLNPHYALPDYYGGHLSTNGYRWFGEMIGKTLYDVLVDEKMYRPVQPETFTLEGDKITIEYHVPAPPLVFDTWTTPKASYNGFSVYNDHTITVLKSVEIVDENKVVITANKDLTGKEVEIVYAGTRVTGTGNLRDSDDSYTSAYTYFDDSADEYKESYTPTDENGNKIYGQHYPMQNWSVGFYHKISGSSSVNTVQQNEKMTVFPNPAKDKIEIRNNKAEAISIFTLTGIEVLTTKENSVHISSLPDGIYLVKSGSEVCRIMKE